MSKAKKFPKYTPSNKITRPRTIGETWQEKGNTYIKWMDGSIQILSDADLKKLSQLEQNASVIGEQASRCRAAVRTMYDARSRIVAESMKLQVQEEKVAVHGAEVSIMHPMVTEDAKPARKPRTKKAAVVAE